MTRKASISKKQFLLFLLCFATFKTGLAQAPEYSRTTNETLNYREINRSTVELTTPQGMLPLEAYHDATIAILFTGEDSAQAFYEALVVSLEMPQQKLAPDTSPVIGQPFVLHFPASGRVRTLGTPTFPESFEGVTDLRWQFWDFFLPLPSNPLENGLVWSDTIRASEDETQSMEKVGRYEVSGDTLIGGLPAKVILFHIENRIEVSASGPSPEMTLVSKLAGAEHGAFYFSPEKGLLIGRKRIGGLSGELRYEGGPQTTSMPQVMEYEGTIDLLTE